MVFYMMALLLQILSVTNLRSPRNAQMSPGILPNMDEKLYDREIRVARVDHLKRTVVQIKTRGLAVTLLALTSFKIGEVEAIVVVAALLVMAAVDTIKKNEVTDPAVLTSIVLVAAVIVLITTEAAVIALFATEVLVVVLITTEVTAVALITVEVAVVAFIAIKVAAEAKVQFIIRVVVVAVVLTTVKLAAIAEVVVRSAEVVVQSEVVSHVPHHLMKAEVWVYHHGSSGENERDLQQNWTELVCLQTVSGNKMGLVIWPWE